MEDEEILKFKEEFEETMEKISNELKNEKYMLNYTIKSLKDYTDEEIIWFLENNEKILYNVLGAICSEFLRRQVKKD